MELVGGHGIVPGGGDRDGGGLGDLVDCITNWVKCRGQSRVKRKFNVNCFAPSQG